MNPGGVRMNPRNKKMSDEELVAHEKALNASYAEAAAFDAAQQAKWLAANPDLQEDEEEDYEQEARERRP